MSASLDQDGLFAAPGLGRRRHERNADKVIRTLRDAGTLDARQDLACSAVRAAARAVDAAEHVVSTQPSAYAAIALAQTARALVDVLRDYGLAIGGSGDGDAFRAFLDELDGATSDTTQP